MRYFWILLFILGACSPNQALIDCTKSVTSLEYQNEMLRRQLAQKPDTVIKEIEVPAPPETLKVAGDSVKIGLVEFENTWAYQLDIPDRANVGVDVQVKIRNSILTPYLFYIPERTKFPPVKEIHTVERDTIPDNVSIKRAEIAEAKLRTIESLLDTLKWAAIVIIAIVIVAFLFKKFGG